MNSQENAVKENQAAESSCLVGVLPGVSMGGVMEGAVREEWKGEGRAREGGELAQMSFRRVYAHTSLVQT